VPSWKPTNRRPRTGKGHDVQWRQRRDVQELRVHGQHDIPRRDSTARSSQTRGVCMVSHGDLDRIWQSICWQLEGNKKSSLVLSVMLYNAEVCPLSTLLKGFFARARQNPCATEQRGESGVQKMLGSREDGRTETAGAADDDGAAARNGCGGSVMPCGEMTAISQSWR